MLCLLVLLAGVSTVSASNVEDVSNNSNSLGTSDYDNIALDTNSIESLDSSSQAEDNAVGSTESDEENSEALSSSSNHDVVASTSENTISSTDSTTLSSNASSSTNDTKTTTKCATKLKITSSTKKYYRGGTFKVRLLNQDTGKALSGKKVKITINGKTYTRTTDSKGYASKDLFYNKTVKIKVSFAGDSSAKSSSVSAKLAHKLSKSSMAGSSSAPYNGYFKITLKNSKTGRLLNNKKITFKVSNLNKTYTARTNKNGVASFKIKSYKTLKVKAIYKGSINYGAISKSFTVKIYKPESEISGDTSIAVDSPFTITLKNVGTDKAISGKKVTFALNTTGKTYTRTTNSKGQASVNINSLNPVTVKVSYAGDKYAKKSSKTFELSPVKANVDMSSSGSTVPYGSSFSVTLKHSSTGKALANRTVTFKVNGTTHKVQTNSNGVASIKLGELGKYDVTASYAGNSKYNKETNHYDVTVAKLKTSLSLSATSVQSGNSITVTLKESNKKVLSGQKVSLTIDGKTYTKKTNSKGKASFAINNPIGKYPITIKFGGTEGYKSAKLSKTLNVKISSSGACKAIYGGVSSKQYKILLNVKEKFDADEFAKYLKTGGYSKLNSALKKKAASLTKDLKTNIEKANAIYEFVRSGIAYSYYANSKKGASGTLSAGSGNCVDQASLVVALCRSQGIYARYSHAQGCKFDSGLYTGHVWAQIYDPATQTWYVADPTSRRNNLGCVNNWNTNSYSKAVNYVLVPF